MSAIQPTLKNTKQEILDAYEEVILLLSAKDKQSNTVLPSSNLQPKTKPFDPQSPEEIVAKIGELKLGINKILGNLVDDLTSQSEQLSITKLELESTKQELEQVYKIKQNASTLQNILQLNQDKKLELEKQIEESNNEFEIKQAQKTKEAREQEEILKLKQKREQDEYDYNLKQSRKKEADEYENQKQIKIKELEVREQVLIASEKELAELRKNALEFDTKLDSEIQKAINKSMEETKKELEISYNLERKDVDMHTQLAQMTITNLQKSISQQESEIVELKKQLVLATQQVKDIAVKVIEQKQEKPIATNNLQ
jgi:DNA repair exonuclease SbcCD ATPase subunit